VPGDGVASGHVVCGGGGGFTTPPTPANPPLVGTPPVLEIEPVPNPPVPALAPVPSFDGPWLPVTVPPQPPAATATVTTNGSFSPSIRDRRLAIALDWSNDRAIARPVTFSGVSGALPRRRCASCANSQAPTLHATVRLR